MTFKIWLYRPKCLGHVSVSFLCQYEIDLVFNKTSLPNVAIAWLNVCSNKNCRIDLYFHLVQLK